ncbi:MAG: hypothetical protein A2075_18435 [Geobacteraceae bacterium GWC2_58_44]|nr:MAG: hypothetical protein A2075_18435 [Geobacteraceae bacterium GWC2_58_44]HBG06629.1 DUF2318 domain-containing protein [Geobacter sp.]
MNKAGKNGVKYGVSAVLVLLVAVTVAFGFSIPGMSKFEKLKPENGAVTVPVAKVSDGKAHYFRVAEGAKDINFFVVKGSDGVLHTAFDACDVCFKEKKGYVQKGDQMVCTNCNQKFAIARIGAASSGGCNPSYLPAKVDAANVRISLADLKAGARFF